MAAESCVNMVGEMSVQEADKLDLGRGRVQAVMSPHSGTAAISLRDVRDLTLHPSGRGT